MNELKNLPEYTDRALNGLVADESLKHRILSKAAETGTAKRNPFIRPVMILGTVVAACLLLAVALDEIAVDDLLDLLIAVGLRDERSGL